MKKLLLIVLLLMPLAAADISQEDASNTCNAYALEGESINVNGPVSCEGEYWVCDYTYYGNDQNVVMVVGRTTGTVLDEENEILPDILSTKYAMDKGSSYLLDTSLSDPAFSIELEGMNSTLKNYLNTISSLEEDGHIKKTVYIDFKNRINDLRDVTMSLAEETEHLYNLSSMFWESPDCVELIDFREDMNRTIALAENFTELWSEFISRYNAMAESVDAYVATINPSDAQIMGKSIGSIREGFENYGENSKEFVDNVLGNMGSRFERKEAKDELDRAYGEVSSSENPEATNKYNEAVAAFNSKDYERAESLSREAISLAGAEVIDDEPTVIVEKPPDYTFFFIAIGILLAVILFIVIRNRDMGEDEEEDEEEPKKKKKKKEKGNWAWTKEKESSMEKKSSKGLLDSD
jgi:hypothetical protein